MVGLLSCNHLYDMKTIIVWNLVMVIYDIIRMKSKYWIEKGQRKFHNIDDIT